MTLVRVTPPSLLPVDLALVKSHLGITTTASDPLIVEYIRAATRELDGPDGLLSRALITQTWRLELDHPGKVVQFQAPNLCHQGAAQQPIGPVKFPRRGFEVLFN